MLGLVDVSSTGGMLTNGDVSTCFSTSRAWISVESARSGEIGLGAIECWSTSATTDFLSILAMSITSLGVGIEETKGDGSNSDGSRGREASPVTEESSDAGLAVNAADSSGWNRRLSFVVVCISCGVAGKGIAAAFCSTVAGMDSRERGTFRKVWLSIVDADVSGSGGQAINSNS
jgi:hypothetical protein